MMRLTRETSEGSTAEHDKSAVNPVVCGAACLALGAGLMFLLDPSKGGARRSIMRGKMTRAWNQSRTGLRKTAEYTWDSTRGLAAETRAMLRADGADDERVCARVRSAMGRATSHPKAIRVSAREGVVTVGGPILAHEEAQFLKTIASVRGVRQIVNHLEPHGSRGDLPALQGGSLRTGKRSRFMQEYWPPTTRLAAASVGASLALYGIAQRGFPGMIMMIGGGALFARGVTNLPARRIVGIGAGRRAIDVQKTININVSPETVFAYFADYANFPAFMANIREVRDHGNGRSHWVVAGPAGMNVEWDADVTCWIENECIAWKSVEGSTVENAGVIRFQPNEKGGTRVDIKLSYNPPGGALGHVIAKVFGADPKSEMDSDLARMKTTLETGIPPHDAAQKVPTTTTI